MIISPKKSPRKSAEKISPKKDFNKSPEKKRLSINTPNLSLSSPIRIKRKSIVDNMNNKNNLGEIFHEINRKDQRGIPIMKKSKLHKISFIDVLSGKDLIETITIESYKKYNKIEEDNSGKILNCRCVII